MNAGVILGRGISFPPRLDANGRWAWSQGGGNVREAIQVILMTDRNERLMLPDFGGNLGQYLFEPNTATTRHLIADRITKALAAWEPRVRVEAVTVEEDPADPQAANVTITYQLVATQARERMSLTVSLAGS